MAEKFKQGDLVFITMAGQDFLSRNKGDEFNIGLHGRLGKILEIYDWGSTKGKEILEGRKKHFTWRKLNSESFKYVILIYCPDLVSPQGKKGVAFPELFAEFHPVAEGDVPMFEKWDDAFIKDAFKGSSDYDLVPKVAAPKKKLLPRKWRERNNVS